LATSNAKLRSEHGVHTARASSAPLGRLADSFILESFETTEANTERKHNPLGKFQTGLDHYDDDFVSRQAFEGNESRGRLRVIDKLLGRPDKH
jgi:hypothetical protein